MWFQKSWNHHLVPVFLDLECAFWSQIQLLTGIVLLAVLPQKTCETRSLQHLAWTVSSSSLQHGDAVNSEASDSAASPDAGGSEALLEKTISRALHYPTLPVCWAGPRWLWTFWTIWKSAQRVCQTRIEIGKLWLSSLGEENFVILTSLVLFLVAFMEIFLVCCLYPLFLWMFLAATKPT